MSISREDVNQIVDEAVDEISHIVNESTEKLFWNYFIITLAIVGFVIYEIIKSITSN